MGDNSDICNQKVILDSINEGVFTVDNAWRITEFNHAAQRITGVSRAEALGQLLKSVATFTVLTIGLLLILAQIGVNLGPLIASAGVIGLFAAFTIANPHKRIVSLFIVELPAWVVLAAYIGLSAAALVFHWAVGIGHAAHLAGITAGVLCALTAGNKKPPLN